jgi:hypothetical protein
MLTHAGKREVFCKEHITPTAHLSLLTCADSPAQLPVRLVNP